MPIWCVTASMVLAALGTHAEEEHAAVTGVKDFIAAHQAGDTPKMLDFVSAGDYASFAKSGKAKDFLEPLVPAAGTEGAVFSFEGDEENGRIAIQPAGLRVPVKRRGDPWNLAVEAITGEVAVSPEEAKTYREIYGLLRVLGSYKKSIGQYPTTEQGLQAIATKPTAEPVPRRWFRLRSEVPKDAWGNEFVYTSTEDGVTIRSLGPDGQESGDDLVNPF